MEYSNAGRARELGESEYGIVQRCGERQKGRKAFAQYCGYADSIALAVSSDEPTVQG